MITSILFAAIVACGAAHVASRDPLATSRIKIIVACVLLAGFLVALAGWRWLVGEEDLSGVSLLVWPTAAIGGVVVLCWLAGVAIGRRRVRSRL